MNVRPIPRVFRCLLQTVAWTAAMTGVSAVSAQVMLPQLNRADGDNYLYPVHTMLAPVVRTRPEKEDDRSAIARKLSGIVLSAVAVRSMTVQDAVQQLYQESYQYDPDPDPITRGVKIILRLPPPMPTPTGKSVVPVPGLPPPAPDTSKISVQANVQTRITLVVNGISLLEALHDVAALAGLRLEIQKDAACLVPNAFPLPGPAKHLNIPPPQTP